jgi:hypothetical protein
LISVRATDRHAIPHVLPVQGEAQGKKLDERLTTKYGDSG